MHLLFPFRVLVAELSVCSVGECYLTDWTVWSPCQLSCVSGDDLGFGSVQVRSRAVVAQDPENLLQCPEQELEARPCTGQSVRVVLELKMTLKSFTEAYYRSACWFYSRGHFSPFKKKNCPPKKSVLIFCELRGSALGISQHRETKPRIWMPRSFRKTFSDIFIVSL